MPMQLLRADMKGQERLKYAGKQLQAEYELRSQVQRARLQLQDAWLLTYLLVDLSQTGPGIPEKREKYYSPRPANIVDTAKRVLSRNPIKYHATARHLQADAGKFREEIRNFENVLHGLQYDIDRQLSARGELVARQQTAFHSLVRGAWAYKLHLSTQAKTSTGSPIYYEQYDPRTCYPVFDKLGLESVVVRNVTTLGQMLYAYDAQLRPYVDAAVSLHKRTRGSAAEMDYSFLHVPLDVYEWSSREEQGLLLDLSGLPDWCEPMRIRDWEMHRYVWLQEPYRHGFDRCLVQYGHVNGIPIGLVDKQAADQFLASAALQLPVHRGGNEVTLAGNRIPPVLYLSNGSRYMTAQSTVDPAGAMAGRSIYANIAHLFPELNKLYAALKQAVLTEVRGTWVLNTRSGQMVTVELGDGTVNPLAYGESLSKVDAHIQAPDAFSLLQAISQEISDGTIDLRFILASEGEATGALRARLEQAALIATEDYKEGQQQWAVSVAESFVAQYRAAGKGTFKKWSMVGREGQQSTRFFVVDVDDTVSAMLGEGAEPPVIEAAVKVAMPVDMVARINMAKVAIDPSNPIMSLAMALDLIMEFDDPQAAQDMILQDVGNRNPSIQLMRIADAFAKNGAPELAQMILQDNFRSAFANQVQNTSAASVTGDSGAARGIQSGTAAPELTSGGQTEQQSPGRTTAPARMQ